MPPTYASFRESAKLFRASCARNGENRPMSELAGSFASSLPLPGAARSPALETLAPSHSHRARANPACCSGQKITQRFHVVLRAVAQPAIELRHVFQLLTARARHAQELYGNIGQRAHVAPQFLELGDGENVLLRVAPAVLDFFQRDVRR